MIIFIIIYNFIILPVLFISSIILAIFNKKVRKGLFGRINSFSRLKEFNRDKYSKIYWFHSSSHGEYQQVETLIKKIKKRDGKSGIIASFFSPSGFENVKDKNIDLKLYLPIDFLFMCTFALKITKPKIVFFTSNDFWPSFLFASKKLNIPTILTSARYNKFYNTFFKMFDKIFCIKENDFNSIKNQNNKKEVFLAGNPRFDRILGNYNNTPHKIIHSSTENLTFASMWQEDNKVILENFLNSDLVDTFNKIFIVPHELSKNYLNYYCSILEKKGFSYKTVDKYANFLDLNEKFIIVNKVGFLSKLYSQSTHTYVGGGFSKNGIHNIVEPAAASNVILFGPNFSNANKQDALSLAQSKGGFLVNDSEDFSKIIFDLKNKNFYNSCSNSAKNYVIDNAGATNVIMEQIIE